MLKVSAPLRIDICGGVTDIYHFAKKTGTCITNIALDIFLDKDYKRKEELSIEFSHSIFKQTRLFYNKSCHNVQLSPNDKLILPKSIIKFFNRENKLNLNLDISILNNLPINTGLGGSSAVSVALLAGLYNILSISQGKKSSVKPSVILNQAFIYETKYLKKIGGFQDYISSYYGGLNNICFTSIKGVESPKYNKHFGIGIEKEIKNYFNNNMLILLMKKNNKSSSLIVEDEIKNFNKNDRHFISCLKEIKKCNGRVFDVVNNKGELSNRLNQIGKLINKGWESQKQLSQLVGKGLMGELEQKFKHYSIGLRGPGAGVNSLFLLLKPNTKSIVLKETLKYGDEVQVIFPRINETGLKIFKLD